MTRKFDQDWLHLLAEQARRPVTIDELKLLANLATAFYGDAPTIRAEEGLDAISQLEEDGRLRSQSIRGGQLTFIPIGWSSLARDLRPAFNASNFGHKLRSAWVEAANPPQTVEHEVLFDWLGNEIRAGDVVAYPYAWSRSSLLALGQVESIYEKVSDSDWRYRLGLNYQQRIRLRALKKSEEAWKSYSLRWERERKPSTLQYWDRLLHYAHAADPRFASFIN